MADFTRRGMIKKGVIATAGLTSAMAAGKVIAQTSEPVPEATPVSVGPEGSFTGRVVLITGATSGIGEATTKAFAQEGAQVFFAVEERI